MANDSDTTDEEVTDDRASDAGTDVSDDDAKADDAASAPDSAEGTEPAEDAAGTEDHDDTETVEVADPQTEELTDAVDRPTPTPKSPMAADPDIDALMAFVGDDAAAAAPATPPPPPPPAPAHPTPLPPRPPLPTEPIDLSDSLDEESPYSRELDIPPPHSVPVPMPAPEPTVRPQAVVVDVSPASGPTLGGTGVTLHGKHLYRVSIVRFGGELAQTIGAREPSEVKVLAPAAKSAGAVDISVQNPGTDETTLANGYEYLALPAPKIDSVAPTYAAAAGGTEISVIGKNFVAETRVFVGTELANKSVFIDATTLEVVLPGGKSGALMDVSVENPDGKRDTVKRAFKYS